MAKKRRKQIPLTSTTSAPYNLSKKLDKESILKFFNNIQRPIILKILTIFKMNSGVISWDNDSHELIINGKHYAGSNIVDILTYLTSKHNHDRFYVSTDYSDRTSKLYGLPDKTLDFINAINSIIPARNLEDLFLMLRFHPAKVKRIRQAANEVTQKRLQRFDNLLLKATGSVPKKEGAKALRQSLDEMGRIETHRHYPPLISELTCSVPADARKKTTPEMK